MSYEKNVPQTAMPGTMFHELWGWDVVYVCVCYVLYLSNSTSSIRSTVFDLKLISLYFNINIKKIYLNPQILQISEGTHCLNILHIIHA